MSDANTREKEFLIIRRSGSAELESPKGGVWKIAYADFMTAMMAFFLVMWLINATSETTKTGVANYFNPIKLSDGKMLPRKGLHDPEDAEPGAEDAEPGAEDAPEAGHLTEAEPAEAGPAEREATDRAATEAASAISGTEETPAQDAGHAARKARFAEDALFRDPYAVLASIAAEADGVSSLVASGGGSGPGAGSARGATGESYGDPFDPSAWGAPAARAGKREAPQPARTGAAPPATLAADVDSANDLPRGAGPASKATASGLRAELLRGLEQAAASRTMPNISVENADGGVLISLADQVDFGMFAIGSAEPLPQTIAIMEKIAGLLKDMPGEVIIRGHTDGRPFHSENYDNWRLSAARAHMAYHMLVRGGLDENRVGRIEGYADRDLKLPDEPAAAENRRIDILIQEEGRS